MHVTDGGGRVLNRSSRGLVVPDDDDDKATGEAVRRSVVAPAQRSPQARAKALTKRTDEGTPVHSFHTLLRDLRTMRFVSIREFETSMKPPAWSSRLTRR